MRDHQWPLTTNDAFQRWQQTSIEQVGYAVNLILTFTVAVLGYWFVLIQDKEFNPDGSAKCAMLWSLLSLVVAAVFGLICVVVRLLDFRGTARRARQRPDAPSQKALRELGGVTWGSFWIQIGSFILGVVALAIALLLTYGRKIV